MDEADENPESNYLAGESNNCSLCVDNKQDNVDNVHSDTKGRIERYLEKRSVFLLSPIGRLRVILGNLFDYWRPLASLLPAINFYSTSFFFSLKGSSLSFFIRSLMKSRCEISETNDWRSSTSRPTAALTSFGVHLVGGSLWLVPRDSETASLLMDSVWACLC